MQMMRNCNKYKNKNITLYNSKPMIYQCKEAHVVYANTNIFEYLQALTNKCPESNEYQMTE